MQLRSLKPLLTRARLSGDFLAATNEMNSPTILVCPQDSARTRTASFVTFNNKNLSYFVGLNAGGMKPTSILSGDRTISTNGRVLKGLLALNSPQKVQWASGIHTNSGNIGFGDGSVQSIIDAPVEGSKKKGRQS